MIFDVGLLCQSILTSDTPHFADPSLFSGSRFSSFSHLSICYTLVTIRKIAFSDIPSSLLFTHKYDSLIDLHTRKVTSTQRWWHETRVKRWIVVLQNKRTYFSVGFIVILAGYPPSLGFPEAVMQPFHAISTHSIIAVT